MARYIIGDIHGCYQSLRKLLSEVDFNPSQDELWAVGDLIGRGADSLRTLTYLERLGAAFQCSLGNHDIHFLAVYNGLKPNQPSLRLTALLAAENINKLVTWLRYQPLTLFDQTQEIFVSHAGIPPAWSINQAQTYAREVEYILTSPAWLDLLAELYGNEPSKWCSSLLGFDRYRFIVNALTRMRYCFNDGQLELTNKMSPEQTDQQQLQPWYSFRPASTVTLFFGHWAALAGKTDRNDIIGLDTGCVWGGLLTLYDCQRHEKVSVQSVEGE